MWYEHLRNIKILKEIYNDIPKLNNVNINSIDFDFQTKKIHIFFEMPRYCDNPLSSWKDNKIDRDLKLIIRIGFEVTQSKILSFKNTLGSYLIGDIDISKNDKTNIEINIIGTVSFIAEGDTGEITHMNRSFSSYLE